MKIGNHKFSVKVLLGLGAAVILFAILVASITVIVTKLNQKVGTLATTGTSKVINFEPPAALENFNPMRGGVLVLAANTPEYQGVIVTLKERNKLRKAEARMSFREAAPGITKVNWNVRVGSVLRPVTVHVANIGQVDQGTLRRHAGSGFRMIALRGHTSDMKGLYEFSESFQNRHCFAILGGCQATAFIKDVYRPNKPIMADAMTGESANNTYLLVRTIDLVGSGGVTNWEQYAAMLGRDSARASAQTVMPGQPGYDQFVIR